jgi:hypothetical protein
LSTQADQHEQIVSDYVACNEVYVRVKSERKAALDRMLALFPKEAGDYEMTAGPWKVEVSYPARKAWDSEELAAYYGTDAPAHVKRVLSIDERSYARLPLEEREILAKCFTPAIGSPKVSVETK